MEILGVEVPWCTRKDLVDAVDKASVELGKKNSADGAGKRFPLSPSQALNSERDLFYGLCNFKNPNTIPMDPFPAQTVRVFELGHLIEDHLVGHIKNTNILHVTSVNERCTYGVLSDGTELSGEYDFLTTDVLTGEVSLNDSKSSADYTFKLGAPKESHIAQLNLYMHSRELRALNINTARVWFYNKNTSALACFEFNYSKELAERTLEKFQKVYDMFLRNELPKREYVYGLDWQANYSSFRTYDNREFNTPFNKRDTVVIDDSDIKGMDKRELTRYIAMNYSDNVLRCNVSGDSYWLELGTKGLILKGNNIKM